MHPTACAQMSRNVGACPLPILRHPTRLGITFTRYRQAVSTRRPPSTQHCGCLVLFSRCPHPCAICPAKVEAPMGYLTPRQSQGREWVKRTCEEGFTALKADLGQSRLPRCSVRVGEQPHSARVVSGSPKNPMTSLLRCPTRVQSSISTNPPPLLLLTRQCPGMQSRARRASLSR